MNKSRKNKMSASTADGPAVMEAAPVLTPGLGVQGTSAKTAQAEATAPLTAGNWLRNRFVTGLWTKNEDRNSWVAIRSIGWKKLANKSDTGNLALNVLAAQALQTARPIDYREEADGMIHEIYVW